MALLAIWTDICHVLHLLGVTIALRVPLLLGTRARIVVAFTGQSSQLAIAGTLPHGGVYLNPWILSFDLWVLFRLARRDGKS